jgi:hypothetical protein
MPEEAARSGKSNYRIDHIAGFVTEIYGVFSNVCQLGHVCEFTQAMNLA